MLTGLCSAMVLLAIQLLCAVLNITQCQVQRLRSSVQCLLPIIPTHGKLREEDYLEFEGYTVVFRAAQVTV